MCVVGNQWWLKACAQLHSKSATKRRNFADKAGRGHALPTIWFCTHGLPGRFPRCPETPPWPRRGCRSRLRSGRASVPHRTFSELMAHYPPTTNSFRVLYLSDHVMPVASPLESRLKTAEQIRAKPVILKSTHPVVAICFYCILLIHVLLGMPRPATGTDRSGGNSKGR